MGGEGGWEREEKVGGEGRGGVGEGGNGSVGSGQGRGQGQDDDGGNSSSPTLIHQRHSSATLSRGGSYLLHGGSLEQLGCGCAAAASLEDSCVHHVLGHRGGEGAVLVQLGERGW